MLVTLVLSLNGFVRGALSEQTDLEVHFLIMEIKKEKRLILQLNHDTCKDVFWNGNVRNKSLSEPHAPFLLLCPKQSQPF